MIPRILTSITGAPCSCRTDLVASLGVIVGPGPPSRTHLPETPDEPQTILLIGGNRWRSKPWLARRTPHPNPPPQGGRGHLLSLPPCGGGLGWGVFRRSPSDGHPTNCPP